MTRLVLALALLLGLGGCASVTKYFSGSESKPAAEASTRTVAVYELEVDAPRDLRSLLLEHLDLARFQRAETAEQLSNLELDRLSASTPAQAKALLETEGYFNAEVLMSREPGDGMQRVRIEVKPGPRTRITALDLSIAAADENQALQDILKHDWALPVGAAFSQSAWSSAKSAVLARIRAGGYPLARWDTTSAQIDAPNNSASLILRLDSGPLFHVGELRIEGLKKQSDQIIRRLAGFAPGEPFSERALLDFQERLQKTLLFDSVSVELQPDPAQYKAAIVLVRVTEAPLQQGTVAVGYHANSGQNISLEHIHRQPLGFSLRSRSKLDLGRDRRAVELELSSHPQPDMQRNLGSLLIEQDRSGDLITTNLSARLGRLRETARDERLIYTELLRGREVQANNAGTITSGAISLNTQWIRRRLDSALLPTEGHQALLLVGAGRADNSASPSGAFARSQLKLGWYKPLGQSWYANARLELGQVFAADAVGIPDKLLFRAGGDDSVRGYAYQSLGPLRNGLVVGGRVVGTSSFEIARPISASLPDVWGAVFVDGGNAANSWGALKPAIGWGAGIRWRSPVGPLRIDVARGEELKRWRLHFSVGIAL